MGKTKTAFVAEAPQEAKSSEEKYKEKKLKQAAEAAKAPQKHEKAEKVHIAGLKGGQRIKMMDAEVPQVPEESEVPSSEVAKATKKAVKEKVRGKKYQEAKKKIKLGEIYSLADAITLVKETSYSKFDGTFEAHLTLKKTGVSANITLPFSGGRAKKVEVASEETFNKLKDGKVDFDVLLATPDMMPKLVPFARLLGPKGLMPNPKNGTLISDIKKAKDYSANTLSLKTEREAPLVHTSFGKVSQKDSELKENLEAILKALGGSKQIIKGYIKSTMSPAVKITV